MPPGCSLWSALSEVGLRLHRFAFDGQNDVGATPLRVVHQHLPCGAAGRNIRHDQAADVGGQLELLRGFRRYRLDADTQPPHDGAGRAAGLVGIALTRLPPPGARR